MYHHFEISGFSDEISPDIDAQFAGLNTLGIRYFEPRGVDGKNISDLTDDEAKALRAKMDAHFIKASSIGSPIGKIMITDDFEPHFEKFCRTVAIAKILGTKNIRIFSFYIPEGHKAAEYTSEVIARLKRMADYAEKEGVLLLHENEKGIFGATHDCCKIIFDELYSDHFKGVFDPANFIQTGCDTLEAFNLLSPYIAYMHIKDALPTGAVVPAGQGIGHVAEILKTLKDEGRSLFLSLEPHLGEFNGLAALEGKEKTAVSGSADFNKFALAHSSLMGELKKAGYNPDKVRMGIIGFGNMGQGHAKSIMTGLVPKMTLAAVCDTDPEKAKKAAEMYRVPVFTDDDEMLKSGLLDAVLIAVPHYDHPVLAEKAFASGLNVLTEKPAGVYTKQVIEMNDAAKKSGLLFGIMFNQRTNPMYRKVREMVKSGSLGHIKRISWTITDWYRPNAYHNSGSWRSHWATEGGGTLVNQNPHQLDLWQWMFGMPDYILADCSYGKYHDIEVDDEVTAYLKYDNGTTGTYITSTAEAPGTNRLEIAADMGKIVIENGKMTFDRLKVSEPEFDKTNTVPFGCPESEHIDLGTMGQGDQHVGILNNYAEALLNGEALLAPGEEGIFGVTVADAMYLSDYKKAFVDTKNFPHDEYVAFLKEKISESKKENQNG